MAAERGQRVLIRVGSSLEVHVALYDFTKFSMIPSVALINEIPGVMARSVSL